MKPVECFSHSKKKVFVDICTVRSLREDVQWFKYEGFCPEEANSITVANNIKKKVSLIS